LKRSRRIADSAALNGGFGMIYGHFVGEALINSNGWQNPIFIGFR
jgi:hypothetical protein